MTKTYHMKIDLRGELMNWRDRSWQGCCHTDNARLMSPAEVKALDKLALGDRFYPMGPCDGFDPKSGCPGHDEKGHDESSAAPPYTLK
jgi:hypothetical protein